MIGPDYEVKVRVALGEEKGKRPVIDFIINYEVAGRPRSQQTQALQRLLQPAPAPSFQALPYPQHRIAKTTVQAYPATAG